MPAPRNGDAGVYAALAGQTVLSDRALAKHRVPAGQVFEVEEVSFPAKAPFLIPDEVVQRLGLDHAQPARAWCRDFVDGTIDKAAEQRRTQERMLAAGLHTGSVLDALRADTVTIEGVRDGIDGAYTVNSWARHPDGTLTLAVSPRR